MIDERETGDGWRGKVINKNKVILTFSLSQPHPDKLFRTRHLQFALRFVSLLQYLPLRWNRVMKKIYIYIVPDLDIIRIRLLFTEK